MTHDVFISYSSKDQKIVEGLSAYLEQQGIRCFVAYRDIPAGEVWAAEITIAIEDCKCMVVVFSENFNSSPQVDREIELCFEERKTIIPLKIQDSKLSGAKKYYLKNIHWIDAFPEPEKYFGELCVAIKKFLSVNTKELDSIGNIYHKAQLSYGMSFSLDGSKQFIFNIIQKDTPLPYSNHLELYTFSDNQEGILIEIYESNSKEEKIPIEDGLSIFKEVIDLFKPLKRHTPIKILLKLDIDGILKLISEFNHEDKLYTSEYIIKRQF